MGCKWRVGSYSAFLKRFVIKTDNTGRFFFGELLDKFNGYLINIVHYKLKSKFYQVSCKVVSLLNRPKTRKIAVFNSLSKGQK